MENVMRKMLGRIFLVALVMGIGGVQKSFGEEPTYVGAAKCKLCHMKQHAVWSGSKHAKAFGDLKPAEQQDPQCLHCHVTGYRATQQAPAERVGVQCEACHGPASLYIKIHPKKDKEGARKAGMIVKPEPAGCTTCHNEQSPTFKGFDYATMWEQIKHPR